MSPSMERIVERLREAEEDLAHLPFAVLDIWVTVYQWVCFPIYGIPRVPRRAYFAIDSGEGGPQFKSRRYT